MYAQASQRRGRSCPGSTLAPIPTLKPGSLSVLLGHKLVSLAGFPSLSPCPLPWASILFWFVSQPCSGVPKHERASFVRQPSPIPHLILDSPVRAMSPAAEEGMDSEISPPAGMHTQSRPLPTPPQAPGS